MKIVKKVGKFMARKKRTEEVSIVSGKLASDVVTDLEVLVRDEKIGEIFQDEDDRQIQVTYMNGKKGSAISIEEAVRAIIAEYNLHK